MVTIVLLEILPKILLDKVWVILLINLNSCELAPYLGSKENQKKSLNIYHLQQLNHQYLISMNSSISNECFLYIGNLAWKVSGDRVATVFIAFCLQRPKTLAGTSMLHTASLAVQQGSFIN